MSSFQHPKRYNDSLTNKICTSANVSRLLYTRSALQSHKRCYHVIITNAPNVAPHANCSSSGHNIYPCFQTRLHSCETETHWSFRLSPKSFERRKLASERQQSSNRLILIHPRINVDFLHICVRRTQTRQLLFNIHIYQDEGYSILILPQHQNRSLSA